MASTIKTFNSKGSSVNYSPRSGVPKSPLGKLDTATGTVWQHPRIRLEPLSGRNVKITNPKASGTNAANSMTGSIGMGGQGQRGRNRDVGSAKARGEA